MHQRIETDGTRGGRWFRARDDSVDAARHHERDSVSANAEHTTKHVTLSIREALDVSLADRRARIEPEDGGAEFAQRRYRQGTEVRDDPSVVVEDANGERFVVTQGGMLCRQSRNERVVHFLANLGSE